MSLQHESIATAEFTPRYTLSPEEISAMSEQLLTERPPTVNDQYICYLVDGTDELSNLGRHIEREVFEESFKNDDRKMKQLYGAQEASSQIFIVMDQVNKLPVGAMRVTQDSEAGLGTLQVAEEVLHISREEFEQYHGVASGDKIWDIGTAAVPEAYRSEDDHLISNVLYRAMHMRALHEGVKHYVSIIDSGVRGTFDFVGIPFVPIANSGSFSFEGSEDSQAMYGDVSSFIGGVASKYEQAGDDLKPFLSIYAGRLVAGQGIDHRFMFDFS